VQQFIKNLKGLKIRVPAGAIAIPSHYIFKYFRAADWQPFSRLAQHFIISTFYTKNFQVYRLRFVALKEKCASKHRALKQSSRVQNGFDLTR
jgi:hypothetical protein